MELLARRLIRDVPDFPKEGILFKDVTPVMANPAAFAEVVSHLRAYAEERGAEVIAGIEARGFILGAPVAIEMGAPFIPVRKLGKLPGDTIRVEYDLEYGTNTVEMQRDAIRPGQRVLIVDDLLATGGTCAAAARLLEQQGGEVVGCAFMVELGFLRGREALEGYDTHSLIEL